MQNQSGGLLRANTGHNGPGGTFQLKCGLPVPDDVACSRTTNERGRRAHDPQDEPETGLGRPEAETLMGPSMSVAYLIEGE